jgi:HEAT repeat protein
MTNAGRLTGKFGEEEYLRALMLIIRGTDEQKVDAAIAFGGLGKIEQWSVVTPLLSDSEAKVRAAAAQALMTLGAADSGPAIFDAMSRERDKWSRVYLAGAVQKIRYAKAVPVLIDWLADSETEVVNVSEMALRALTNENLGRDRDKWQAWYDKNH